MLTPERLTEMRRADNGALNFVSMRAFEIIARAVEAEVRKEYTELIQQMYEALENHDGNYKLSKSAGAAVDAAITAARKRLEGVGTPPEQPATHPPTVAACIARLEQGGQSAAVSILRHHFEQKGG